MANGAEPGTPRAKGDLQTVSSELGQEGIFIRSSRSINKDPKGWDKDFQSKVVGGVIKLIDSRKDKVSAQVTRIEESVSDFKENTKLSEDYVSPPKTRMETYKEIAVKGDNNTNAVEKAMEFDLNTGNNETENVEARPRNQIPESEGSDKDADGETDDEYLAINAAKMEISQKGKESEAKPEINDNNEKSKPDNKDIDDIPDYSPMDLE